MAGPPSYPADSHLNSHTSPPSVSSQSNVVFTPSATSVADSSDNEYDPTPVHSPGGPQYDDLPPSYEDARHQAVHDARNGIAPIDPNQIEAHRITMNEGPNEPEVWEYRVRGEQPDPANEQEHAPDYANHTRDKATSVPVQHVSSAENIPVGRTGSEYVSPQTSDLASTMLSQALGFTRHQPDAASRHAPHLNRIIAIPGEGGIERPAGEHEQFLCAYTQTLHGHSVEPDQFLDFLRGLNVLLRSTNTTATDLLEESSHGNESSSLVSQYIRGANEAFFAPRGLQVSFRSEATILATLPIPSGPGQRAEVASRLMEEPRSAAIRAQRLTPWIEPLNTEKIPALSEHMYKLHELGERFAGRTPPAYAMPGSSDNTSSERERARSTNDHEDPPHSVPTATEETQYGRGQQGEPQRGNWSPFGGPGFGPFGRPGNGPFGPAGHGPFGAPGNGPFGRPGRGPFGAAGNGPFGGRGRGRGPGCGAAGPSRQGNNSVGQEWAEVGKELGKIGEEFGRMMGGLGMQIGQQANRFGMNVQRAATGSSSQQQQQNAPRSTSYGQPPEDLPPSYEPPTGQESGVLRGDHKIQPDYTSPTTEKGKNKARDMDDSDDDDTSSTSSDSSDSDSDSDSDDEEEYQDADKVFDKRMRHIEEAVARGTKTPEEVSRERASVQQEKQKLKSKYAIKKSRRAAMRDLKKRGRELKKQHRQRKRELRAASYDGKGKGKAKKSKEWKVEKKAYKEKRKALRKEKLATKKEWRNAKREWGEAMNENRRMRRVTDADNDQEIDQDKLVWLVIENLGP